MTLTTPTPPPPFKKITKHDVGLMSIKLMRCSLSIACEDAFTRTLFLDCIRCWLIIVSRVGGGIQIWLYTIRWPFQLNREVHSNRELLSPFYYGPAKLLRNLSLPYIKLIQIYSIWTNFEWSLRVYLNYHWGSRCNL